MEDAIDGERLRCVHVLGKENGTADSMSRLSKSGDYELKRGVLQQIEAQLEVKGEVDLFATARNTKYRGCATVEEVVPDGETIVARDALTIRWTGWTALLHPPIATLPRVMLICTRRRGISWMAKTRPMMASPTILLGNCSDLLHMSEQMRETGAALPPGQQMACLLRP
jgi:hypothetical protein